MMNENDELILEDDGNLYWQIALSLVSPLTTEEESLKMLKMRPRIGEVEEEFVDVVQDVLKELKQLREVEDEYHALDAAMDVRTDERDKAWEEIDQWETHWKFLHAWLEEIADGHISGNDVLKVMDELRRGNDNES